MRLAVSIVRYGYLDCFHGYRGDAGWCEFLG